MNYEQRFKSLPSNGGRQYFMNIFVSLLSLSAFPVSSMIPDCAYFRTVTSDYFEIKMCPATPHYMFQATNTQVLYYIYQYDFYLCQIEKYARNDFFYYFNFLFVSYRNSFVIWSVKSVIGSVVLV